MKYLLNFTPMLCKQLKIVGIIAVFSLIFAGNMSANIFSRLIYFEGTSRNTSIKDVLKAIERQTEYTFFYNDAFVDLNRPVHVEQQTVEVGALLDKLFKNTNLTYREQENNFIVITPKEQLQAISISGVVTDESGAPLPGVNIMVKGTTTGMMTDADGKYTIQVRDRNAVLVFSYIGMKSIEMAVGNQSVINITLKDDAIFLDEVVTIGYTTSKRRDMVGSVAKVTTEQFATPAYGNITAALQGKASGVYVTGGDIRIRGMNSINLSTEPMWIIDGVPGGHNNLNPNDIESVTVLKDAAATAMYGSSGANGVIVVTTKSFAGQKTQVNVEIDGGTGYFMGTGWKMMDSKTYIAAYDLALQNTAKYEEKTATPWDPYKSYDWIAQIPAIYRMTRDEALKNSHRGIKDYTQNAEYGQIYLSVNKGFDKGNASVSLTYRNGETVQLGGANQKFVNRIVFNVTPVKNVTFNFNSINNFRLDNKNTAGSVLMRPPYMPVWDWVEGRSYDNYWGPAENPVIMGNSKYRQERDKGFSSSNYLKIDIDLPFVQGLKVAGIGSAGFSASRWTNWYSKELKAYRATEEIAKAEESAGFGYSYMVRGEISYNRTFGDHTVGAIGWVEGNKGYGVPLYAQGYNLNGSYPQLGEPGNFTSMNSNRSESGSAAYMGRLTYNFKNKYFFEGVIRHEGLSNLVEKYRWATFPSVGLSWIVSEESFWTIKAINLLKLRGSIGKSGNAAVPAFTYIPGFQYRSRTGDTYEDYQITRINRLAAEVQWETSDNMDFGIDFGLLDNRINGSIAYFNKETSGLLLQVPLPPSAGIFVSNSVWSNIGNMRNNGIEFNVDIAALSKGQLKWNTSFNYTYLKNEVLALSPQVDLTGQGIYGTNNRVLTRAGGKLATYFVAEYAGIDPQKGIPMIQQRNADVFKASGQTVLANKLIPASMANCTSNQIYMDGKSYIPSYFGGWRNTFRYGNMDLNLMISYTGGHYYFDQVEWRLQYVRMGQFNLISDRVENAWKKPGDNAKYMEVIYNGGFYYNNAGEPQKNLNSLSNDYPTTSNFLKRGDNVQLKEVTLGYNLPRKIANKAGMENGRVFFNVNNALYWAIDQQLGNPDVGIGNNNVNGIERWEGFMSRTFSLGVSVTF